MERPRCLVLVGRHRGSERDGVAVSYRNPRHGHRDKWRVEILRTSRVPDSVRVVLLVMHDYMTDAGYVSVPRSKLAEILNRSPRRVTERIKTAIDAGLLAVVQSGRPGQTARYMAVMPSKGADGGTKLEVRNLAPTVVRTGAPHVNGKALW